MTTTAATEQTRQMLRELEFSPCHTGYKMLCIAIPSYAKNNTQSITKELYPSLSKQFGSFNFQAAERSIRYAIAEAWRHGDPEHWKRYFPKCAKAPSNMVFIAELSELLK